MIEKIESFPTGTDLDSKALSLSLALSSRYAGDVNRIGYAKVSAMGKDPLNNQLRAESDLSLTNVSRDVVMQQWNRGPLLHRSHNLRIDGGTGAFYLTVPSGYFYKTIAFTAMPVENTSFLVNLGSTTVTSGNSLACSLSASRWTFTRTGFTDLFIGGASVSTPQAIWQPTLFILTKSTELNTADASNTIYFGSTASVSAPASLAKLTVDNIMLFQDTFTATDAGSLYDAFYGRTGGVVPETMTTSIAEQPLDTSQTWNTKLSS